MQESCFVELERMFREYSFSRPWTLTSCLAPSKSGRIDYFHGIQAQRAKLGSFECGPGVLNTGLPPCPGCLDLITLDKLRACAEEAGRKRAIDVHPSSEARNQILESSTPDADTLLLWADFGYPGSLKKADANLTDGVRNRTGSARRRFRFSGFEGRYDDKAGPRSRCDAVRKQALGVGKDQSSRGLLLSERYGQSVSKAPYP